MERAITEILYMVSQGKTLEVALYTVLSNYTMTRNDNAVMVVNHSWEEDLMMYLKRKTIEGASRKTLENYKYVIQCVLETINKPTKEITSDDLQLYIMYKKNVSGSSEKYLLDIRTKLNGFFAWACKTKVIDFNPMDAVAHIKVHEKHIKAFNEEELERMRCACDVSRHKKRDRAMLELMDSSGIRCNELVNLNIDDIDLDERKGIIHNGKGGKERTFLFSKVAALYLREYLKDYDGKDGALFVSSVSKCRFKDDSSVEAIVRQWGIKGGVKDAKPHRFRHTFITRCINKGISMEDTRVLAGHENVSTTAKYYDNNHERIKTEHDRLCA